eukprot:2913730-Pleurochrysis_carterae.AAC.1
MSRPDLRRATTFSGSFAVYTSVRVETRSKRGAPASRGGRSAAVVRCPPRARGPPAAARKFPMFNALFHRLLASSAMPEAPLLRTSLLATLCLLYVSSFCNAELIAYLPERKTWLTRASLLWVIRGVSTKHPTLRQLEALPAGDMIVPHSLVPAS